MSAFKGELSPRDSVVSKIKQPKENKAACTERKPRSGKNALAGSTGLQGVPRCLLVTPDPPDLEGRPGEPGGPAAGAAVSPITRIRPLGGWSHDGAWATCVRPASGAAALGRAQARPQGMVTLTGTEDGSEQAGRQAGVTGGQLPQQKPERD